MPQVPFIVAVLLLVIYIIVVILLMSVATAMPIGMAWLCLRIWRRLLSTMTFRMTDNRILYWPVVLAIVWPLLLALLVVLYQVFWLPVVSDYIFVIVGLGLAAMWIGSVIVACRLVTRWAAARHWRMMLSALILPLTFLPAVVALSLVWTESGAAAPYALFFVNYGSYLAQVEKRPAGAPRFIVWTLFRGPYDDSALLYDDTDEVTSDHPSEAWKKRAVSYGVIRSGYQHITGHFYFVAVDPPKDDVRHDLMQGYDLYKSGRISPGR